MKQSFLLRAVAFMVTLACALGASAAEAYACYTPSNTTLTFYYDTQRSSRLGTTYDLNTGINKPDWVTDFYTYNYLTKVVFDPSFAGARPTSTCYWFHELRNLESITGMSYLNTSEVTEMCHMFDDCIGLTSLDLRHFDTSKVTDMMYMFYGLKGMTSLDLSSFNTSNVTDMSRMFTLSVNLQTIYVGDGWSTAALIESGRMFLYCDRLVGGQGTTYDAHHDDASYAHIDGGPSNPGYFTEMAPEAYACYTESNTTLTFYYDKLRLYREGRTYNVTPDYQLVTGVHAPGWAYDGTNSDVTRVVFDPSFADARPTYTSGWFYYMTNLQSIIGIENLDTRYVSNMSDMFRYCSSLTSLDVSGFNTANVYYMSNLFDGCSNLGSLNLSAWNTSKVENMQHMFKDCTSLTTLDLSSWDTSDLTYLVATFYGCSGLTSLNLSSWNTSKVTTMELMFYNCSNLTSIYVYNGWNTNMVHVSTDMFLNCTSLVGGRGTTYDAGHVDKTYARIDRGPGTPGYFRQGYSFLVNGIYYNITGSNTVEVASDGENSYSGIVTIPSSVGYNGVTYQVTGIGNDAFYNCTDLDSVSIPPTVTAIKGNAFYNCSALEHVTLPAALTTIGDDAFHLCWDLRDITIPDNVEYIGAGAFMECSNLASVVIGNSVNTIGQQAFDHCASLTSVVIPNSVTTIGKKAFYYNGNLEGVVIGSGVTSIGNQAFYSCTNLRNITCRATTPPTMAASDVFDNPAYTYATLIVPNGTKSAYQNADWWRNFANIDDTKCHDFAVNGIYYNITGGNTVEVSFKDSGFNSYSGNVTIPGSVDYNGMTYQVTGIGNGAFAMCAGLTGVTIPATVTYIGDVAFYGCSRLARLALPDALLTIGEQAFRGCTGLTTVTIPNAVTTIGERAFYDCSGLTSVTIGTSVSFIGSNAFGGCEDLTHVTCLAFTPPTMEYEGVFEPETYQGTLTVPAASLSAYQSTNWWKNFTTFTTFVPAAYAVYTPSNTTLTFYYDNQRSNRPGTVYDLTLPDTSIWPGWYFDYDTQAAVTRVVFDLTFSSVRPQTTYAWFSGMSNLTTITGMKEYLNTSEVTNMNDMFSGCSSLTSLDVSGFNTSNVEYMASMFYGCSNLKNLDLSSFNTSNVSFMSNMFSYCRKLQSVNLSSFNTSNVVEMSGMFIECNKLASVDLSSFNTSNVTNMHNMFLYCSNLTSLDLSSFNTSKVTDMQDMFAVCPALTTIYVGDGWSTAAVTSSNDMFYGCTSLVGGMGTTYDANHVDKAYAHIDGGPSNPGYFTAKGGTVLRGDVNGDGHVSIADVSALIDYLLSGETAPAGADCNQSGNVSIADVSSLIDYLLSGQWP